MRRARPGTSENLDPLPNTRPGLILPADAVERSSEQTGRGR